ncbi:ankyrin repeat domain-containing protein [Streptomyces sp. NPDC088246]|uniref:ankyrin repeat domain-containing protein n=1 Tax=Streptomyces sp. NPDC088246 TaxID=3365842 RepID=UPI00382C10F1
MNNRKRKKLPKRLAAAAGDGHVELLQRLLAQGADPDTRDPDGATPLYLAAVQGENRCAELLLAAGALPNAESRGWRSGLPLAAAATKANLSLVELLLRHGADPHLRESEGGSALDWAQGWSDDTEERQAVLDRLRNLTS